MYNACNVSCVLGLYAIGLICFCIETSHIRVTPCRLVIHNWKWLVDLPEGLEYVYDSNDACNKPMHIPLFISVSKLTNKINGG